MGTSGSDYTQDLTVRVAASLSRGQHFSVKCDLEATFTVRITAFPFEGIGLTWNIGNREASIQPSFRQAHLRHQDVAGIDLNRRTVPAVAVGIGHVNKQTELDAAIHTQTIGIIMMAGGWWCARRAHVLMGESP